MKPQSPGRVPPLGKGPHPDSVAVDSNPTADGDTGDPQEDPPGSTSLAAGLYVVSTPIGNLGDITLRAIDVLRSCDRIACEDTRVTGRLLEKLDIPRRQLLSYRDENESRLAPTLCEAIAQGERVALVSDAGTPLVSDPGYRLVRACRDRALPVFPVPGPSAVIAALSASGMPCHAFSFLGFLPPKKGRRESILRAHLGLDQTVVFYESTHRIERMLDDLVLWLEPSRQVAVAREITKHFETFVAGTAQEVRDFFRSASTKGEFVVLIAPPSFRSAPATEPPSHNDRDR